MPTFASSKHKNYLTPAREAITHGHASIKLPSFEKRQSEIKTKKMLL
jgi:hypothetical protein